MLKYINEALEAPKAIGPYSQAAQAGNLVFLSGQIPIDPKEGKITASEIEGQAIQVMKNIKALLEHQGLSFANVAKTTIFLTDLANFQTVNQIYSEWMGPSRPARSTIQVAALPLGAKIEIEMIALRQ